MFAMRRRPPFGRYLVVCLALTLGLMSKPMVVTLPLVLLLLDYWPLGRFNAAPAGGWFYVPKANLGGPPQGDTVDHAPRGLSRRPPRKTPDRQTPAASAVENTPSFLWNLVPLLLEKLPLLVMSVCVSVVTCLREKQCHGAAGR